MIKPLTKFELVELIETKVGPTVRLWRADRQTLVQIAKALGLASERPRA